MKELRCRGREEEEKGGWGYMRWGVEEEGLSEWVWVGGVGWVESGWGWVGGVEGVGGVRWGGWGGWDEVVVYLPK